MEESNEPLYQENVEWREEIVIPDQSSGMVKVLDAIETKPVQIFIFLNTYVFYFIAVLDCLEARIKNQHEIGEFNMQTVIGHLRDFAFCFDYVYLIEFLLHLRKRKLKHGMSRHGVIMFLDLISIIPYDSIYLIYGGSDKMFVHYSRLRIVLRFSRYVPGFLSSKLYNYDITNVIIDYCIISSLLCITETCLRIGFMCGVELKNCDDITSLDYFVIYSTFNSKFTSAGIFFINSKVSQVGYVLGVLQIFIHSYHYLTMANILCVFTELLGNKFTFARTAEHILKNVKEAKTLMGSKWNESHELILRFLINHINMCWFTWSNDIVSSKGMNYVAARLPETFDFQFNLDCTWNMFKHSILFKNEDVHFLRKLSSMTKFVQHMQFQRICLKGQFMHDMIYIVSGVVQVFSEENSENQIVAFTGGTCIGESCLFLSHPSNVTMICQTQCLIIKLSRNNFIKIAKIYPKVYKKLKKQMENRLKDAELYIKVGNEYYKRGYVKVPKKILSLRYIKKVIGKYLDVKQTRGFVHFMACDQLYEAYLLDKSVFCTHYLTMYVIADYKDTSTQVHFVKTGYNFKMNPASTLIVIWNFLIIVVIIATTILYPFIATIAPLKYGVYDFFMYVVTVLYAMDFISFAFIAYRDKEGLTIDLETLARKATSSFLPLVDFFSAFPLEWIMDTLQGPYDLKTLRALQINRMLKFIKLVSLFKRKQVFSVNKLVLLSLLTCLFSGLTLVFFGYFLAHTFDYYQHIDPQSDARFDMTFIYTLIFSTNLVRLDVSTQVNLIPLIALQYLAFLWKVQVYSQMIVSLTLSLTQSVSFQNWVEDVYKIFSLNPIRPDIRRMVMRYLHMHYEKRKVEFMLGSRESLKLMGTSCYKSQCLMKYGYILKRNPFFCNISPIAMRDFIEVPYMVLIPKGEFVVSAGAAAREFYLIEEGICAYLNDHTQIIKTIYSSESFPLIEMLSGINIVHNIVTLTDCKLLCFPRKMLLHKLVMHKDEYETVFTVLKSTVNKQLLTELQNSDVEEYDHYIKEEVKSFKVFTKEEFDKGFEYSFLRHTLFRITVYPGSKYWLWWSIFHVVISYLTILCAFHPFATVSTYKSYWFFIFRVPDLVTVIGMYFRHHLIFYNDKQIEISHPYQTALEYWKGGFWFDLVAGFPLELLFSNEIEGTRVMMVVAPRMNRLLQLYKVRAIKKFLNSTAMSEIKTLLSAIFLGASFIIINAFVIFVLFGNCKCYFATTEVYCDGKYIPYWDSMISTFRDCTKHFFNMGLFYVDMNTKFVNYYLVLEVVGMFVVIHLTSLIIGLGLYRNTDLTTYQVKMGRMTCFLNTRKIDKRIRDEIIRYYEHIWILMEGRSMRRTFLKFNRECYEQVIYTQSGIALRKTKLFKMFSKAVLKDFLANRRVKRVAFLILGVIIRVNDVQNYIYIVCDGVVDALGPDKTKLQVLGVGSVFGCLDKISWHRSTLTYVAKTHCILLRITSNHFYHLIDRYPRFNRHYSKLVRSSNFDYIVSQHDQAQHVFRDTTRKKRVSHRMWKRKHGLLKRFFQHFFPVFNDHKSRKYIFIAFYCIAFLTECYQKMTSRLEGAVVSIYICYICDAFSLLILYLNFSTKFEDEYGLLVTDRKQIAMRYIKHRYGFFFDLVCVFPFEIFCFALTIDQYTSVSWLRINRILKIVHVFNFIFSMQNRLNINVFLIRITFIVLLFFTFGNLVFMFFGYFLLIKNEIPEYQRYYTFVCLFVNMFTGDLYNPPDLKRNDLINTTYILIFTIVIFLAQYLKVYLFAQWVASHQIYNSWKYLFEAFLHNKCNELETKGVSSTLYKEINDYCNKLITKGRIVQFPTFILHAPSYLREGVLNAMFGFHLRQHPVLKNCHSDLIRQFAGSFRTLYFFKGDIITYIGDIDNKMYFIHEGEVHGLTEDNMYYEIVLGRYKRKASFGFRQLFYDRVGQDFTFKAMSDCIILYMERHQIIHLLDFFPASKRIIYDTLYSEVFPMNEEPQFHV